MEKRLIRRGDDSKAVKLKLNLNACKALYNLIIESVDLDVMTGYKGTAEYLERKINEIENLNK